MKKQIKVISLPKDGNRKMEAAALTGEAKSEDLGAAEGHLFTRGNNKEAVQETVKPGGASLEVQGCIFANSATRQ